MKKVIKVTIETLQRVASKMESEKRPAFKHVMDAMDSLAYALDEYDRKDGE